jgi:hypothetical protein
MASGGLIVTVVRVVTDKESVTAMEAVPTAPGAV